MKNRINMTDPAPLYEQIERDIISQIENGELEHGEKIGSNQELANAYNVSLITIKKALSNLISKNKLFTRVGKGTYVTEISYPENVLSTQKTIGLVLRDLQHPFFSRIMHSIEKKSYELGYTLLLSNSSGDIIKEENQLNNFRNLGVDGLIIASLSLEYKATNYIQKLHEENFPYMMVSYIHDPDYWYVGSNHELGGFMATEHLIKLGYKSIAYAHIGNGNLLSEVRKNGYYRALTEYNMPFNSDKIFFLDSEYFSAGADRMKLGYEFGLEFSSIQDKPEAIVLYSDLVAMGFLKACQEKNIAVPEEVAIVGFDDIEMAKHANAALTTIRQDYHNIGALAVENIQKRINKIEIGNRTILKPTLVVRKSCGA